MLAGEWKGIVAALGISVRHLRHLLGWSQQELASRAVTSQGTVSRIESGHYPDLPFHSIVVVLRALEQGAHVAEIQIVPPTRSLLDFAAELNPAYHLTRVDPDLARLLRLYHTLTPRQRAALITFVNTFLGGSHGKKVHSASNQETGSTPPRPRRAAGQENPQVQDCRRGVQGWEGGATGSLRSDPLEATEEIGGYNETKCLSSKPD